MADLNNEQQLYAEQINFVPQEPRIVYNSDYTDPDNNLWTCDLVGTEEAVNEFMEVPALFLHAQPLSREEFDAEVEARTAGYQADEGVGEEDVIEEQFLTPPEDGLPNLEVIMTLRELVIPRPYRVHFIIDPPISSGSRTHSLNLIGNDSTANVSYKAEDGTIKVTLTGPGGTAVDGPAAVGSVSVPSVSRGTSWRVIVTHVSGTPANYTLTGDIDVD